MQLRSTLQMASCYELFWPEGPHVEDEGHAGEPVQEQGDRGRHVGAGMHKLGAAAATPLPESNQRQLGDGKAWGPRARLRAKLQRNPADAVAAALVVHPLHGDRITTISLLLKTDQGDVVIPAKPAEIGPDLALA